MVAGGDVDVLHAGGERDVGDVIGVELVGGEIILELGVFSYGDLGVELQPLGHRLRSVIDVDDRLALPLASRVRVQAVVNE